ncbi:hypothetical protein SAMN04488040_0350 [Sulfitobacter marinus]|uniref:Tetratricopeptide repeat-like domain-containing protein n=1 Tax=Sulfitobacter marinus TaxID=394264 RepID=A0A1I6PV91_9RHOB|nr:tetratricopeptide repeat protein [Sulfitobacter marinus]SFS43998.1 hypothetical protein SAMN04488040_0350 [Sulfitobacter marinus]
MSDTDSFIDEVNEEVRRDRFYFMLKRYGWIAVLAVVLLVGGAAWNEYQKAHSRAKAEALGDAMFAALAVGDSDGRITAFKDIEAGAPQSAAVVAFLTAAEQAKAGDTAAAIESLNTIATNGDVPAIYREIAQFKALTLQGTDTPVSDRRLALEALAQPGNTLRLLASEQLALIEIEQGNTQAAIDQYQAILLDAEVSTDLQQRALQVIVALGGEPEMGGAALGAQPEVSDATGTDGN